MTTPLILMRRHLRVHWLRTTLTGLALLFALVLVVAACDTEEVTPPEEPVAPEETPAPPDEPEPPPEPDEPEPAPTPTDGTLQAVIDRGELICGVNATVAGFGFQEADGSFSGFDVDYCRAVAAAVLGDSEAVEFVPLTTETRFPALQAGEVDVLIRNTTWTATRDGAEGTTFLTTTFYDGQGMMVFVDDGIADIDEMDGLSVCVLSATTTELNLATRFAGMSYTPATFEDNETLWEAFIAGACDGWTSDKSQLAAFRATFPEEQGGPEALVILEETFSKEPLGPVVRDGDSQWAQVIDWVVIATIQAEEWDITSGNLDTFADTDDLDIRRFLGLEFERDGEVTVFDPGLGLEPGWTWNVIEQVGNYGEIYERNITPLGIPRGENSLWTEGGLLYAPPYR